MAVHEYHVIQGGICHVYRFQAICRLIYGQLHRLKYRLDYLTIEFVVINQKHLCIMGSEHGGIHHIRCESFSHMRVSDNLLRQDKCESASNAPLAAGIHSTTHLIYKIFAYGKA